jgi:hypothetical protein
MRGFFVGRTDPAEVRWYRHSLFPFTKRTRGRRAEAPLGQHPDPTPGALGNAWHGVVLLLNPAGHVSHPHQESVRQPVGEKNREPVGKLIDKRIGQLAITPTGDVRAASSHRAPRGELGHSRRYDRTVGLHAHVFEVPGETIGSPAATGPPGPAPRHTDAARAGRRARQGWPHRHAPVRGRATVAPPGASIPPQPWMLVSIAFLPWKVRAATGAHRTSRTATKSLLPGTVRVCRRDGPRRGEAELMDPEWTQS